MLIQPLRNLGPLALLDPEIPGRTEPQKPDGAWGINFAAAKGNFPDKGLKVHIPTWANMSKGDSVKLLWQGGVEDQHTITQDTEIGERVTLWVEPGRLQTGAFTLSYTVKRLSQQEEPHTPPVKLDVKLELPGGQDLDPDWGHSGLYMGFEPPEIVQDGVDKDTIEDGVYIIVKAEPGSGSDRPYEHIAVGDVITASWGGKLVVSAPVTLAQIADPVPNPIKVHIDEATLLAAGDSDLDGLAVTFMVRDRVLNQSEDWCKETRIVVDTGNSRLEAPILKQANGSVLDLDRLGDEQLDLQVWVATGFQLNDTIIMKIKGTTLEGEPIEVTVRQLIEKNPPVVVDVMLPNAPARALAKTQAVFSYDLERGDSVIQRSKGRFINIIGEPKRLAAPIAVDEQQGALDPDLPRTTVRIPFDPLIQTGMAIELVWFGVRADLSTYEPLFDWFFPSDEEANDPGGFTITVEGQHLKTLEGGTLKLSYNLLSDEDGVIVSRSSLPAAQLNVGEPQFELVKPIVLGEQNGVLEPNELPGGASKLTAQRPTVKPTEAGDIVTYTLIGEVTGKKEDSVTLNSLSKDKDVNFSLNAAFVAQFIEPNRGTKMTASYRIWRAKTNETSHSNVLEFFVGVAVELEPATITSVKGSPSGDEISPGGDTIETSVTLTGTAKKGQKVRVLDGDTPKGEPTADLTTGIWSQLVTDLSVTLHSFTAEPLYGAGTPSEVWELTVLADDTLSITSVKGSPSGVEIPTNTSTTETAFMFSGKGSANLKIELRDAGVVKAPITIGSTGDWTHTLADQSEGVHRYTVKVLDGAEPVSDEWKITVGKALTIDDRPMNLNGKKVIQGGNYGLQAKEVAGNTAVRAASGGVMPYTYKSLNPEIASVETSGKVTGLRNGSATITVTDAAGNSVSYPAQVTNVYRLLLNDSYLTPAEAVSWMRSVGAEMFHNDGSPIGFHINAHNFVDVTPIYGGRGISYGRWATLNLSYPTTYIISRSLSEAYGNEAAGNSLLTLTETKRSMACIPT
ncbi:Ig-like domain-containing protein [Pseudomonas sp. CLCA07]